jgi:hypothetical protein
MPMVAVAVVAVGTVLMEKRSVVVVVEVHVVVKQKLAIVVDMGSASMILKGVLVSCLCKV